MQVLSHFARRLFARSTWLVGIVAVHSSATIENQGQAEIADSTAAPTSSTFGVRARASPGRKWLTSRRPKRDTVRDAGADVVPARVVRQEVGHQLGDVDL